MLPATVGCLILVLSVTGFAQTNSWEELRGEGKKAQKEARYADAEMHFRAARDEAQRLGTSNPRLLTSLNDLAEMFQAQGRYGDADEYLVRVLTLKQEALGFASPEIVPALEALASNQLALKKQYEVQALLRQSLNILEKTYGTEASELLPCPWSSALGSGNGLLATSYDNLAAAQAIQGKHALAEGNYRKALEIRDYAVAYNLHNVAQALEKQGRLAETDQVYQSSRSILDRLPNDSPLLPLVLTHHAAVLRKLKKDVAAAKLELRVRQFAEPKKPSE